MPLLCRRFGFPAAIDLAIEQDLLGAKPEGEGRMLALLVNKLGDPNRKISSKVCMRSSRSIRGEGRDWAIMDDDMYAVRFICIDTCFPCQIVSTTTLNHRVVSRWIGGSSWLVSSTVKCS